MLTEEELIEIEAFADLALRNAGAVDDDAPDLNLVCVDLTGAPYRYGYLGGTEGTYDGRRIDIALALADTPRERQVLGHECGHAFGKRVLRRKVSEEWCDAFGAVLSAPRRAVRRAIALVGERPSLLAPVLLVEAPVALLRIGEVTGRPVALLRRPGVVIVRGEAFPWPPPSEMFRTRRPGMHPVKVAGRPGAMADRAA